MGDVATAAGGGYRERKEAPRSKKSRIGAAAPDDFFGHRKRLLNATHSKDNPEVVSEANGRAVVNDSPVDCQSREVTEDKFSAENLSRPCGRLELNTKIIKSGKTSNFMI